MKNERIDIRRLEKITKEKEKILNKLEKIQMELYAMCHKKNCSLVEECPEDCECGGTKLNVYTSIIWQIANRLDFLIEKCITKNGVLTIKRILNITKIIETHFFLHEIKVILERNSVPVNKQTMKIRKLTQKINYLLSCLLLKDIDKKYDLNPVCGPYFNLKTNSSQFYFDYIKGED